MIVTQMLFDIECETIKNAINIYLTIMLAKNLYCDPNAFFFFLTTDKMLDLT